MVWIRLIVILCLMALAPILSGRNLYRSGQKYLKQKQYVKAKNAFYRYYKRRPKSFKAPYALYHYTQLLVNGNRVIQSLKTIAKKYPNFPELDGVFDQLASLYYIMGDYDKSYYYYKSILKRFSKSPYREKASYYIVNISLVQKDYLKVESLAKSFMPTLRKGIYHKRIILSVGRAYFMNQKYKKALSLYKRFMKHYPRTEFAPRVLYRMAQCYAKLNKSRKSRQYFNWLVNRYPYSLEKEYAKNKLRYRSNRSKSHKSHQTQYPSKKGYILQIGVFSTRQNAFKLKNKVEDLGHSSYIITYKSKGRTYFKTIAGPFKTKKKALMSSKTLARKGIKNILVRK